MLEDEAYMRRCLDAALKAIGRTSPNPVVGAVVVDDDGKIIAEGFHSRAGQPHAEVEALNAAGEAARGKTLYVSLEPCCHQGRTPPCTEKIIASGVKTVVCGMTDPNPLVSGQGIRRLQESGLEVRSGVLEEDCRYANRAFIKWMLLKRPWVALKMACTLDGRIADRHGSSRWITGEFSRAFVHELRNEYDAVLVGGATACADNAELTVRGLKGSRDPLRVIVDPDLHLSPESKLATNEDGKTLIFSRKEAIELKASKFNQFVKFEAAPLARAGSEQHSESSIKHRHSMDMKAVLEQLGNREILSVLCEGGARLAATLLQEELVDELYWFIAPKLIIDQKSTPVLAGDAARPLQQALQLSNSEFRKLGDDILIHGVLTTP